MLHKYLLNPEVHLLCHSRKTEKRLGLGSGIILVKCMQKYVAIIINFKNFKNFQFKVERVIRVFFSCEEVVIL